MSWSALNRKGDARRHPRHQIAGTLRILWSDANGRERVSNAKLIDVSPAGLRLSVDDKIPLRAYLICNEPKLGVQGRGSVRYCNAVKGRFEIGVEFAGGTGWRAPVMEAQKEPPSEQSAVVAVNAVDAKRG